MIKERVITILKSSGIRLPELEERTGISRYTWNNLKNTARKREIKAEEIEAIVKLFPQYALWVVSGEIAPEAGQISPEYSEADSSLPNQNAG
ncbi:MULTISPECIES: helix-turn-helix domain-containing protein [Pseudomonas]|uniref:helix-turn-helix domain-containing protein n=1 Tax=Pseudomonas TaxID=286 RepID=UPI0009F3DA63|nr:MULTISPECIES: helix-turn-helix domain-containing protein [Pseudomonas]